MPPYIQWREFLADQDHRGLLERVLANVEKFRPAKVIGDDPNHRGKVDPQIRVALTNRDLGEWSTPLDGFMRAVAPRLEMDFGVRLDETSIELELAAHGDGAHYMPHMDIAVGEGRMTAGAKPGEDRVLSAVYYFFREPKVFTGGALRLFRTDVRSSAMPVRADDYVDIEPVQNSLIVFPPWIMHSVRPVTVPGGSFADYRFALNCWFCRKLDASRPGKSTRRYSHSSPSPAVAQRPQHSS